uniref:Ovule protein n=1 Tax=Acrobeloides nanus TaxID=290746 RepID=A0A914D764_9BILA
MVSGLLSSSITRFPPHYVLFEGISGRFFLVAHFAPLFAFLNPIHTCILKTTRRIGYPTIDFEDIFLNKGMLQCLLKEEKSPF